MATKKGELKKAQIIEAMYKLYIREGAGDVTMEMLEKESGQTRGGIFYHFVSMDEIFNRMVERYIFSPRNVEHMIELLSCQNFSDYLQKHVEILRNNFAELHQHSDNSTAHYMSLTLYAQKKYPNFAEKMKVILDMERASLKSILSKAMKAGEIVEMDESLLAEFFMSVHFGHSYLQALEFGVTSADSLEEMYRKLYEQVRKK